MPVALVDAENAAGIGGKLGERKMARRMIPGGSVAHDAITALGTDEHEVGRPGLRTAFGAAGDMNRSGETKARQQTRHPAPVTTCVQSGRRTTGSARASFDLEQGIAGINDQTVARGGIKNALGRCPAGQPDIERAPGRKPDLLTAMGHDHVSELPKLIGFDPPKGCCDSHGEPTGAELHQTDATIQRQIRFSRTFVQRIEPRSHRRPDRRKARVGKIAHALPRLARCNINEGKAYLDRSRRRGVGRDGAKPLHSRLRFEADRKRSLRTMCNSHKTNIGALLRKRQNTTAVDDEAKLGRQRPEGFFGRQPSLKLSTDASRIQHLGGINSGERTDHHVADGLTVRAVVEKP